LKIPNTDATTPYLLYMYMTHVHTSADDISGQVVTNLMIWNP